MLIFVEMEFDFYSQWKSNIEDEFFRNDLMGHLLQYFSSE